MMANKYSVSTAQLAIRFCIQKRCTSAAKGNKSNAEVDFVIDGADMDLLRAFANSNPNGHNPSQR
ncbi:hypothetical protein [Bifidobacterium commune]|uniref:hypothetical protein n=1 Tax=Bifidobacterium commune TaxID=1505727 RepID=UPI00190D6AC8|nr:hypothetical protein [Bifidobacterium commune]